MNEGVLTSSCLRLVSLQGQLSSWLEVLKTEKIRRKPCLYVILLKWGTLCCESEMCLCTVRGYLVCLLPDSVDKGHPSELSIQKWSEYTNIRPLSHQRNITSYFRNWNVNSFKLALFSNNSNYRTDLRHCPDTDDDGHPHHSTLSCVLKHVMLSRLPTQCKLERLRNFAESCAMWRVVVWLTEQQCCCRNYAFRRRRLETATCCTMRVRVSLSCVGR